MRAIANYELWNDNSKVEGFPQIKHAADLIMGLGALENDPWDIVSAVTGEVLATVVRIGDKLAASYTSSEVFFNEETQLFSDERRLDEVLVGIAS